MRILAIETSCDETAAAVVDDGNGSIKALSSIISSSSTLHAKTGGIIPEMASREQAKAIIPTIYDALLTSENLEATGDLGENFKQANKILKEKIDAIAVTYGPGLIGSLLVGVETAKTLSLALNKPLIPINHLTAHIFANFIEKSDIQFPFVGLIVSGGHTDLLYFESSEKFTWLGGTRDDAAGEAIDKIGRILNLSYPAGPEMEIRAKAFFEKTKNQKPEKSIKFQSPMIHTEDFDFSFSGLKAECSRYISGKRLTDELTNEICYAVQEAIFNVLVKKTVRAAKMYNVDQILLGGGVSANQILITKLKKALENEKIDTQVFAPSKKFATDNAAMIGAQALINSQTIDWHDLSANPDLYFA